MFARYAALASHNFVSFWMERDAFAAALFHDWTCVSCHNLSPPCLSWTHTAVRNTSDILNTIDCDIEIAKCTNSCISTQPNAFDKYVNRAEPIA